MLVIWLFAGLGQSLAEMPSETFIIENIAENEHGKVYGSHFAFSHLWWAIAYPLAGILTSQFSGDDFLCGGIISGTLLVIALLTNSANKRPATFLK